MRLPIDTTLPALRDALRARSGVVLQAPPGAGKTTRVPLALLGEPWLAGQRIVMLEPRRLAARAAARYMAATLGERVGETVGYRVRMDTRAGPATRIEVVTEGILSRLIADDPALEGIGLLIFDEFHERHLHTDLGLALALQAQALLRPELRLLVMSATLDGAAVATLLGGTSPAAVVTSEGRSFPVEIRWRERRADVGLERMVQAAVSDALAREAGDVLVFLPGAGEIRRVEQSLSSGGLPSHVDLAPLHGSLPAEAQDRAIAPSPPGRRKIVLATSLAETSLTIEGVRVVIDAGLARVPRWTPRTGMTRLETVRVSRASAEQRAGRAGRLAPGVCYRLWSEGEQATLLARTTPEIMEADLAPLALTLAEAGIAEPDELRWMDAPPAAAFAQARELLAELGALGADGRITPRGRRMARMAVHPRLAHMLIEGERLGLGRTAAELAALLGERDLLRGERGVPDADVRPRLEVLRERTPSAFVRGWAVDRDAVRRVRAEAAQLRREAMRDARGTTRTTAPGGEARDTDIERAGLLLALAYPDRIAQRRPGTAQRFVLRNGAGAALAEPQPLGETELIVAAALDGKRPESRIFLAAPLAREELVEHFGEQIVREASVAWDDATQSVRARVRERLGALVLSDAPLRDPPPGQVTAALVEAIARAGIAALPWSDAARRLRERVAFLRTLDPAWPDLSDAALASSLEQWLAPHLHGARRLDDVRRLDLHELLLARLDWRQRAALDELAPTHVTVPSGSRVPIDYGDAAAPVLAVRLQEMFGLADGPRIAGGRVPLVLHLLSPARRPVQVTRDLAGFWRGAYFDVRKDLRGRYPKHHWPENPLEAEATARAKRRGD